MRLLPRLLGPSVALLDAAPLLAQTRVETFDGGSNEGGWTFGIPCEQILPAGGNPGAHLDEDCLDTFAPQPRTSDPMGVRPRQPADLPRSGRDELLHGERE